MENASLARGAVAIATIFISLGCGASAKCYSKNGQEYLRATEQAVLCTRRDLNALTRAGGLPIGVVSAEGLQYGNSTQEDVDAKAAVTAAQSGGTHVVVVSQGLETSYVQHAGTAQTNCKDGHSSTSCSTTYTPPSVSAHDRPVAKYEVYRVPSERWAKLPPQLRPVASTPRY